MSRVGLYGGSFDPFHNGHLSPVLQAAAEFDLDRVLYLPTAEPPHKRERNLASAVRRFAMVELALLEYPDLLVSDFELTEGPSYTVNTLKHFRSETEDELWLLVGSDSLANIEEWRNWPELFQLSRVGVLSRPGWSEDKVTDAASPELRRVLDAGRVRWAGNDVQDISATEIRETLSSGGEIPDHWMPRAVLNYATKYKLYV